MGFKFKPLSRKQRQVLNWWTDASPVKDADGIICDGAIRTGKTLTMSLSFVMWSMSRFEGQNFGMCGKTIGSFRRNVLAVLKLVLPGRGYSVTDKRTDNLIIIRRGNVENYYYVFGGKDERSQDLIQGITLAGVFLDEVALMPRSFVEQACARCSVEGSKLWFNCNPEGPQHWFYKEVILQNKAKNLLRLQFRLEDNLALSPKIVERYKSMYTGVFYSRFILGEWVIADGLIYDFDTRRNIDNEPHSGRYYISCDYGIMNPFSAHLWCIQGGVAYCLDEYYYDGRETGRPRTDEEHYACIEALVGNRPIEYIVIDPSASSMIETIYRHDRFGVRKANNDVIGGIGSMSTLLHTGRLKYNEKCVNNIKEFGLYLWDTDAHEDRPIKENDHAMDDNRYFVSTVLVDELDWVDWSKNT